MRIDLHNALPHLLGKAHKSIRSVMADELNKRGLDINAAALPILGKLILSGGALPQSELVPLLEVDRHRVSRMVKDLQALEIIDVEANPKNKRENILVFTPKGHTTLELIDSTAQCVMELAYQGISKEAREITEQTLKQITNNLNPENYEVG